VDGYFAIFSQHWMQLIVGMAVACGLSCTSIVTGKAGVWTIGELVLDDLELNAVPELILRDLIPVCVGERDVFHDDVQMTSIGGQHIACVTSRGSVWTWGNGANGCLGHGDVASRQEPTKLDISLFGESPAAMVTCGMHFTMVLTTTGLVYEFGKIGDNDMQTRNLIPILLPQELFGQVRIVMLAGAAYHCVALGRNGRVWSWGNGGFGQLGHNDVQNQLVPKLLEALVNVGMIVHVAASGGHTMAVTHEGELWAWGWGDDGQLGIDSHDNCNIPMHVGGADIFQDSPVQQAVCGDNFSMVVMQKGGLFSWGAGQSGQLGHNNNQDLFRPKQILPQYFNHVSIVFAACGDYHAAAVTTQGAVYTWGGHGFERNGHMVTMGLGHPDNRGVKMPTIISEHLLRGEYVGCQHGIPFLHVIAFAMGTHERLANNNTTSPFTSFHTCPYSLLPGEMLERIVNYTKCAPMTAHIQAI